MLEYINSENAPKAIGPYSQAVKADHFLYLSGSIPINPKTNEILGENIKEQTYQVLHNIDAILKEAGYSKNDVVKTTCFLKDMADFASFNEVYGEYFNIFKPARSCFAVKDLPKNALVEIEVIAYK